MSLGADTMKILYQRTRLSSPSKQSSNCMTAPVETSKLVAYP